MTKTIPFRPERAEALDLDSISQLQLLKKAFNAQSMGKRINVMRSPSGRGYHIYCVPALTVDEAMKLGDCKGRVAFWEIQTYSFTFQERLNWWGRTVGREEPENMLALPFNSQVTKRMLTLRRRWLRRRIRQRNQKRKSSM